jgi:ribosomal protein S18 acetylase RimI-like enzyme
MSRTHSSEELIIGTASPARQPQVLWLLFQGDPLGTRLARVESALQASRKGTHALDALLEARRGRAIVGAILAQQMPGRTAVVWPARVVVHEPESTTHRLMDDLDHRLRQQEVRVAQALLESSDSSDAVLLAQHGYRHAAELAYLVSTWDSFPVTEPVSSLGFEVYREVDRERLLAIIESTYEDTLDIPALNDVRDTSDVLAGYEATGEYDPGRWFIVTRHGGDIGCLLLSDHPEQQQMELVYMGLVPGARGSGWGQVLARHAQWLTRQAGRHRIILAVDAANGPAVANYAKSGFVPCAQRHVYLRVYDDARF